MSRKRKDVPPPAPKEVEQGPLKHNALAALKAARDALAAAAPAKDDKPRAPVKAPVVAKPVVSKKSEGEWKPDRDRELMAVAMSGVVPLGGRQKTAAKMPGFRATSGDVLRRAHAEGGDSLSVVWNSDGTCEAARKGRSFALEALGRFAVPQDRLDLHGLEPELARVRVEEFVRSRRARGLKVVLVVHGVGRHAIDGTSTLRDAAVRALSEPPGSRDVDAIRTAESVNGGSGAVMVALRVK